MLVLFFGAGISFIFSLWAVQGLEWGERSLPAFFVLS